MLRKKHLLLALLFLLIGSTSLLAQDEKSASEEKSEQPSSTEQGDDDYPYPSIRSEEYKDFVPKKRQDQQDKFLDRKYNFPAKPRDKWELGLNGGLVMISGDVKAKPGFGLGLSIRKSLGYIFSVRGGFMFGQSTGRNWQPTIGWSEASIDERDPGFIPNKALAGTLSSPYYDGLNEEYDRAPDYTYIDPNTGYRTGQYIFYNYKTKLRDAHLSVLLNLHNLRFHKRQTCLNFYGFAGIGGLAYRTMTDQLDANGQEYNYNPIVLKYANPSGPNSAEYDFRKDIISDLNDLWDGTYESQAERHFDDWTPFKKFSFKPTAHVGFGIGFRVSRIFTLGLESRVTYTNDDLLDGQRWDEWGGITRDYDTYVYNSLSLNVNLGRKNSVEPLWWMNPLDYAYEELNQAPCCEDLPPMPDLADDDKDGVPNAWDQEPNSREGCPVDTHGRMLDSDRDKVLDCDDREPHTRYDAINLVDQYGVAPKMTCKDLGGDICDCAKACILPPPPPVVQYAAPNPCDNLSLPNILFDLNKYSVKSAFEPQLSSVAQWLMANPSQNLCVIGHTDVRSGNSYNDVLAYKRAQEVIKLLTTKYGISRDRLVLQYQGEMNPAVGGLSDAPVQKGIDADHALNRRVEFRCCMGGDMSMPAGPRNAGSRQPQP